MAYVVRRSSASYKGGSSSSSSPSGRSPLLPQTRSPFLKSPVPNGQGDSFRFQRHRRPRLVEIAILLGVRLLKIGPVVFVVVVLLFVLTNRSTSDGKHEANALGTTSSRFGRLRQSTCRVAPWTPGCRGSGLDALASRRDPFEDLVYKRQAGHLFYPAKKNVRSHTSGDEPGHVDDNDDIVTEGNAPIVEQPHPIHLLISEAKRNWTEKLSRQSKTFKEAVQEYERRYGMRPPKGFDKWYWYAKSNSFRLIDEFDSLHRNILPFLAVDPATLRERSDKLQNDPSWWMQDKAFTVEIKTTSAGKIIEQRGPMLNSRVEDLLDLLEPIYDDLDDMNITMTGHDVPWVVVAGEAKELHVKSAKAGRYLPKDRAEDTFENWDYDGWAKACPPSSPMRKVDRFDDRANDWRPPAKSSFVEEHVRSMDVCYHPERQPVHGFTAWPGPRPGWLFPMFTSTTTSMHSDLLVPPLEQYYDFPLGDEGWEKKKFDTVFWRGSTTGADLTNPHMRKWSQRVRLCQSAFQALPLDSVSDDEAVPQSKGSITLPYSPSDNGRRPGTMSTFTADKGTLAKKWFDFQFQGQPTQCGDAEACKEFEKQFEWAGFVPQKQQSAYKYLIDVDGNGWSGRFHRLMLTTSAVLKATVFPEWYADHIQPWVHYIPISIDYSDLFEVMAFFRGDLEGKGAHDHLGKEIGKAGKEWAERHWRLADMQVYIYRLLLEYNRAMNRDPNDPRSMSLA